MAVKLTRPSVSLYIFSIHSQQLFSKFNYAVFRPGFKFSLKACCIVIEQLFKRRRIAGHFRGTGAESLCNNLFSSDIDQSQFCAVAHSIAIPTGWKITKAPVDSTNVQDIIAIRICSSQIGQVIIAESATLIYSRAALTFSHVSGATLLLAMLHTSVNSSAGAFSWS